MLFDLPKIRTRVRSDFSQESSTGFIVDSEIDAWANEGYYKYATLLMLMNQGYFETDSLLDIISGAEKVALPFNFNATQQSLLKMVRVERVFPTVNVPLSYIKRFDQANPTVGTSGSQAFQPNFDFRGGNLILEPTPTFSETGALKIVFPALPPMLQSANAAAGATGTITLDSAADPRDDYYNGSRIIIVSGTGAGQIRKITDYVGSTKVATVDSSWGVTPDTTSVFSTLIHDDFPEIFHNLIPLYSVKMAFMKERSFGSARAYDATALKEKEKEFNDFCADKTIARQFVQPWHLELS